MSMAVSITGCEPWNGRRSITSRWMRQAGSSLDRYFGQLTGIGFGDCRQAGSQPSPAERAWAWGRGALYGV